MTLALLLTAVGGAWAQGPWTSGDCTVTLSNGTLTVSGNGTMDDYPNLDQPWKNNKGDITSVVVESGVTSVGMFAFYFCSAITSVTLPEGLTAIGPNAFSNCSSLQLITIPSTVTSIGGGAFHSCSAITSITLPEGLTAIEPMTFSSCSSLTSVTIPSTVTSIGDYAFMKSSAISDVNLYANPDNLTWGDTSFDFKESKATQCHVLAEHLSTYQTKFNGANVTFVGDLQPLATPIKVTTNAAEEGATFTEATFAMPANDVTAEYELVRDMSIQMTAQVGTDPAKQPRYRVKKDGNKFIPADMEMAAVPALFTVNDAIEHKALTQTQDYIVQIYAIDAEGQPTGQPMTFATFTFEPGIYAVKAVAAQGSDYDGETALSNTFQLFQGYPVEIAAQSFATYYSDEALTLEDSFAETAGLYTVSEVTPTEAVLSEKIDVMPKRTPMLIYNESDQTQQILLIPTADVAPLTDVADEFKGTAVEKEVTAEEVAATNFYVLTDQNQFVWVKDAGTIAAHRCWLEIAPSQAAGARRIVFSGSETTGIDAATLRDMTTGDWYDLNGRKLNGMPTKKGVYIFNGRKVVVK